MVVALIGVLILSVAGSGCVWPSPPDDMRQSTTLTATWKGSTPTSAPTSGGLTVSGKLTNTSSGEPLIKVVELWYSDQPDFSVPAGVVKSIQTNADGTYQFTLSSAEDTHKSYGTGFPGEGAASDTSGWKQSGWNVAAGYHGLVYTFDYGKDQIKQLSSVFVSGTSTATITVLSAAELQLKYGRYSDAANTLATKLLPRFAKVANPPTTGTSYWIKDATVQPQAYNWIADQTNACRVLSSQITESSSSGLNTVYTGPVIPHQ